MIYVEDEPDVYETFLSQFESRGWRVHHFENLPAVGTAVENATLDLSMIALAVLDWHLGHEVHVTRDGRTLQNGADLGSWLKTLRGEELGVFILSGEAMQNNVRDFLIQHRLNDYIDKRGNARDEMLHYRLDVFHRTWLRIRPADGPNFPVVIAPTGEKPVVRTLEDCRTCIAPSPLPVLLQGESGTGKEFLARRLHDWSAAREAGFHAIDCGAVSEDAFVQLMTEFAQDDDDGTLYLNDVDRLGRRPQSVLTRLLSENGWRPDHESGTVLRLRHRVMTSTTNPKLEKQLLWRLRGWTIPLSPLRERELDEYAVFIRRRLHRFAWPRDVTRCTPTLDDEAEGLLISWIRDGSFSEDPDPTSAQRIGGNFHGLGWLLDRACSIAAGSASPARVISVKILTDAAADARLAFVEPSAGPGVGQVDTTNLEQSLSKATAALALAWKEVAIVGKRPDWTKDAPITDATLVRAAIGVLEAQAALIASGGDPPPNNLYPYRWENGEAFNLQVPTGHESRWHRAFCLAWAWLAKEGHAEHGKAMATFFGSTAGEDASAQLLRALKRFGPHSAYQISTGTAKRPGAGAKLAMALDMGLDHTDVKELKIGAKADAGFNKEAFDRYFSYLQSVWRLIRPTI